MSKPFPRRVFLLALAATGAGLATPVGAQALLNEKAPEAVALGYVADAKRVDVKKFPKYAPGQVCANCALYQGPETAKAAPCTLFQGRQVAGPGWCSAWVKKA